MNKRRRFIAGVLAGTAATTAPTVASAVVPKYNISASNTGAQGASLMRFGINIIMPTTGTGFSVTLPAATGSGQTLEVITRSANFVVIYPPRGASIAFFAPNTAYAIYPGTALSFRDTARNQWDMIFNIPSNYPVYVGLVANPGGGQPNATQLVYGSNVIEVCDNSFDSILLPIALGAGGQCFITNHGDAACDIFPRVGDRINSLPVNAPYQLQAGKAAMFVDIGPPNQWDGGAFA